jgi:hypothetical protein
MKRILIVAAALAVLAGAALAEESRLGRSGMSNVFVWKDSDAHSEAIKLIGAGVYNTNPSLVLRLLSCIAKPGDKAVVTDGGFFSSTVLVTTGDQAGCRGVIANEDLGR